MSLPAVVSRAAGRIEDWKQEIAENERKIDELENQNDHLRQMIETEKREVETADAIEEALDGCPVCGYLTCLLPQHKGLERESYVEMLDEELGEE